MKQKRGKTKKIGKKKDKIALAEIFKGSAMPKDGTIIKLELNSSMQSEIENIQKVLNNSCLDRIRKPDYALEYYKRSIIKDAGKKNWKK